MKNKYFKLTTGDDESEIRWCKHNPYHVVELSELIPSHVGYRHKY